MSQVEAGELLGRHKSWACRRLSLVERLAETVVDDVRAGLVSTTVAREIARLPRGNQADAAASIHRHGLTSREAALLVTLLARAPLTAAQQYLEKPREALESHGPRVWRPAVDPRLSSQTFPDTGSASAAVRCDADIG